MWYIKVNSFAHGVLWYFVSDQGFAQLTPVVLLADAFGPRDVELHRQLMVHVFGADRVELVECSTSKIIPENMRQLLNLA